MISQLNTAPTALPVSVSEVKAVGRIQIADEDGVIERNIRVATELAQGKTRRQLMTATWTTYHDTFPCYDADGVTRMVLEWGPLQSVTEVKYLDTAGATQTLSTAMYVADTLSLAPSVVLGYAYYWPSTLYARPNAVWCKYVAGYGANPSSVPEPIRQWIIARVLAHYENRESLADRAPGELPYSFVDGLLDPYTVQAY